MTALFVVPYNSVLDQIQYGLDVLPSYSELDTTDHYYWDLYGNLHDGLPASLISPA
jgi:hypothetical protein